MMEIEILENRIAPAGIITVSFDKGVLNLVSDNGDHEFSVAALDQWTFELRGTSDTLFQFGDGTPVDTLTFTSPLKSLTATLGDGIDNVSLIGLSLSGDVKIIGGGGDNSVSLSSLSTKGGLQVTGGSGADAVQVEGALSVKKDFLLNLGDGENGLIAMADTFQIGGQLSYIGGSGSDNVMAGYGVVSVGKDLSLKLGSGQSSVTVAAIASLSVGKNLIVDTSDSVAEDLSTVNILSLATRVGGDVRLTDGAGSSQITFVTTGSTGKINVVTGEGNSLITLGYLQLKTKAIDVDASESSGSALQVIGLGTSGSAASIKYTGGVGSDSITAIGLGGASVVADLGDGNNNATLASLGGSSKGIKVTAGSGMDTVIVAGVSGNIGNIDIQTGDDTDNVIVALVNGSAKNITIGSGTDAQQTTMLLANAKVSGKIGVTHGAADSAAFNGAFLNSKIGSLEYKSSAATNVFSLGSVVGIGLPIDGIPIDLGPGFDIGGEEEGDPEDGPGFGSFPLVQGLTVTKGIRVATGDGADTVNLSGAGVKISKGIALELGGGDNTVNGTVSNFVTKGFKVTGGAGKDAVTLSGTGNLGAVALEFGAGDNSASLGGGVVPLAIASLSFVSTSAADATDGLMLARIISAGKVSAKFGAGVSMLQIEDGAIGGLDVDTGAGADVVGIDTAGTYAGTVLTKAATIKLGDGDDTLTLGGNGTNSLLTTKATFSADGGAGTNTLTNSDNKFAKDPKFLNFPA